MKQIGPLIIIEGANNSKVPYSRSLYINTNDKVLIDTGADPTELMTLDEQYGVKLIINTHYHPDHTLHNHLFQGTEKWINPLEYKTIQTIEGIARGNGVYQEWGPEGVETLRKHMPKEWVQNLGEISGTYHYEEEYNFSGVKVHFLHTPGHTAGYTSPFFPALGVVYVGDFDMTSFGPWYFGSDGDIDAFIASGKRLLDLDADTYITGHQKGIFTKQEFAEAMEKYLAMIDQRDEIIEKYVRQGLNFEELTSIGIFYPKKILESVMILRTWERSGIRKHLQRLGYSVHGSEISAVI
ncbi:MBL fold metallo-hydrolase [Bacillus sp. OK048]|uniref:MBL fold metallo-hydrolase n=1 Tax=Bacillus sp. OK048 TaxID=1882761 RepID=UPI0008919CC9|nr:MBL fold metallo-hydrolase [Bacillus sp. OK048]SDL91044.1 Glyoxylase, beta-lactamase superfamily II [Bacillus sp. OK048]